MNIAIVFAGGIGNRFNLTELPKQFMPVNDKEIIVHTLEKFENNKNIDAVILVMVDDWIEHSKGLLKKYDIKKVEHVVAGGSSGQDSIFNGVLCAYENYPKDSVLLIHDGVRPVIDDDLIDRNIETVKEYGNSITVAPAIETIIVTQDNVIKSVNDRSNSWYAKAPQSFILKDVYNNHIKARTENIHDFIDTASLMTHYGVVLHTTIGSSENLKVTTNKDYYMLQAILKEES